MGLVSCLGSDVRTIAGEATWRVRDPLILLPDPIRMPAERMRLMRSGAIKVT